MAKIIHGIRNNEISSGLEDEADYELDHPDGLFSMSANLLPMVSAVQLPRTGYGSRFWEQALPLTEREAPLVRNQSSSGRSWDYMMGDHVGAVKANEEGVVEKITPDDIHLKMADGRVVKRDLFNHFPNNRSTLIHNTPEVQVGQAVKPGDILASSNFTDKEGRLALGNNARIGLAAYKGETMDDALVIRASYAKRLTSEHASVVEQEKDNDLKRGKNHFVALYPKKFNTGQLENLDDEGVVRPGTILQPGDPMIIQTRPRSFNSRNENISKLSRSMRFVRKDASKVWDGDDPAEVVDVATTRDGGKKIMVKYTAPARPGDKIVLRNGAKGTITRILPDEHMPRTEGGEPLDLLLNQLSLPSRVNAATFHEMLLGKVAAKTGKPYTIPAFAPKGQSWIDFVEGELEKNGIQAAERVYDPLEDKYLESPITVGVDHVLKLHHLANKKLTSRGASGYSMNSQPLKGGGAAGGAQRLSGLEMNVLQSSGGRGIQKEAILLRGELRDAYWNALRNNRSVPKLDKPFVWDKFNALLNGTGVNTKDLGKGRIRLTPMTDKELGLRGSLPLRNGEIVNLSDPTLPPVAGGLFDPLTVRENRWGHIDLPFPVVNPSYEDSVRALLGLSKKEYQALLDKPVGEP